MGKTYKTGIARRVVNSLTKKGILFGLGPRGGHILTTVGRRTGRERQVPVQLIERDGQRWLVSPYGPVGWVHNARTAGKVTLRRGRRTSESAVDELAPDQAAPVLREYLEMVPIVRPYFDVTTDSPTEDFVREAPRHPVFLVRDP